jgi:hypothetical protein
MEAGRLGAEDVLVFRNRMAETVRPLPMSEQADPLGSAGARSFSPASNGPAVSAHGRTEAAILGALGTPASGVATETEEGVPLPRVCSTCQTRYPADFLVCPRDATPLEDLEAGEDPLLGRLLGDSYQVVRLVGEGGMGRVYEARHLRLRDRRFAVKVLHSEFARQPEIVARFQREAESASIIGHPNVCDVYDVHKTSDGVPYLIGEFLEGEELGAYIKRVNRLDVPTACNIARQVCRALAAAHARGIVHRDMKPENVFMAKQGASSIVKVLDFGISKAGQRDTRLTETGMIMGTPSYMAPEQARGEKVDLRVDVYAIGALLYQMLTGERPFDSQEPAATLTMVLTQDPRRPRSLVPSIPDALELIIQHAMAKDPHDRYQTSMELADALQPFDPDGLSVSVGTTSKALDTRASGTVVRRRPAAGASGARPVIVLLSGGMLAWLIFGLADALGGVVRFVHQSELTATEATLLIVGIVFIVATPAGVFAYRVRQNVWPNSVRAIELAGDLVRIMVAGCVSYGVAALTARVLSSVLLRDSPSMANGQWDAGLFLASFVGGIIGSTIGPLSRRKERKARKA